MPSSYEIKTGNGSDRSWSISFPFIHKDHVKATVAGASVTVVVTPPATVALHESVPTPATGVKIKIYRETPPTALVAFSGVTLNDAESQRIANLQLLYLNEERADNDGIFLGEDATDASLNWTAQSRRIKNVAAPTAPSDATTKNYTDTTVEAAVAAAAFAYVDTEAVLRPESFGGIGYPTNDTAAVQAAIDALPDTGGIVELTKVFGVADLRLNGTDRDKSNVILRGRGFGTGLKLIVEAGEVNLIDAEGAVGCRVENMLLDGNRANQTIPPLVDGPDYEKYNGVYLEGAADCGVIDCRITNMAVIGVCPGAPWLDKTGADRCWVRGNTFSGCAVSVAAMKQRYNKISENIIYGAGSTYGVVIDVFSTNNEVVANSIQGTADAGIYLFQADHNLVAHNRIDACLVSINLVDASDDNLISDNHCTNASNSHIRLFNANLRNTIANNTLEEPAQYCIVCETAAGGSAYTMILGNRCRGANFSNIALFTAGWSLVQDNYCYEANGSGIYVGADCDWSKIVGNYCYNNGLTSAGEAGVRLVGANNVLVEDNKCFDSQSPKTQGYGVRANEGSMGTVVLIGNDVRFNLTAGMALSGTPIVKRNLGWITEATGEATLLAANTGVTVTHGMNMTPPRSLIKVVGLESITNTKYLQVGNVTPTTFDVYADVAPGGGGLIIGWEAKVSA